MGPLDIAVNVALPAITSHFGLPLGEVQWLVICYVLVYGSLMLVCGKLGDLFGHRLVFQLGLILSAVGCAACAMAPSWPLFLWARAGQGIGTALALACGPALSTSLYSEQNRTKALAGFAAGQALASTIGPLLGGVLVQLWDWPAVYWMRVPLALATLALSPLLPSPKPDNRPFDAIGALLLAFSMTSLLLALVLSQRAVPASQPLALVTAAAWALARFVRHESRFEEPILRPSLFADARFTIPNLLSVLANLASFAILLLTPYYLINVLGLSASGAGLMIALAFVGGTAGAPLAARLVPRLGQRPTAFAGVLVVAVSLMALAWTTAGTPLPVLALLLLIEGSAYGLLVVAYTDIVTSSLARRDRGVAGALALLTRTVGVVSGAAVLSALQARGAAGQAGIDGFLTGYRFAFMAAGGGLLAALLFSCLWPRAWFGR
ncbi:Predicted arabinose efflux permease, MFS family [Enhydrobacter aerosaccus]|uniref:Predicted arabinose efflux permease, MFS family n=2 Tax=Enhydrobacter aerosaccus TaxID=225324 RepID=A0A1T4RMX8_9HYPH|nr:Predicted arabinose efflux permease, MFS family [Enhydrobacter aerosaccus]